MTETVEYGPFWDGYVASVDRTLIGRQAFSEDSRDVGVDPVSGAIVNRPGSITVFDVAGALVGLLEAKWSARARQVLQFESDSFDDGQPNVAHLWGVASTFEGQLGWRSTNGADANQYIGLEYGTNNRSKTNATQWNFMMIPLITDHGTQTFTRCATALARRVLFAGARKVLRVGSALISPNRRGTPLWWNGQFNDSTALGDQKPYIRPLGPMPGMFPIRRVSVPAASATTGTWLGSDRAIWSYVYEFTNGDRSAPMLAQAVDAFTVDAGNPTNRYEYVTIFVPPGPPDCVKRYICRTNKWTAGTGTPEDPTALLLAGEIRNNFQTTYQDRGGDDGALRERPDIINWELIMPPRATSVWTMDGRVVFGDISPSLAVIELAPYSADAVALDGYMFNMNGAYGSLWFFFELTAANLILKHNTGGAGAVTVDQTIALAGQTLQNIVDAINVILTGAGLWPWRAQLLPGADGNALATDLQPTTGTDWFDDDSTCSSGTGNQRVIAGHTIPGVLYMKTTSDYATKYSDPRGLHFTMANPASTGTEADAPIGPNAWKGKYDCRRRLEGGMGRIVGGVSLLDGSLVLSTNGVSTLRNVRGGKTGVDSDYRLEKWKVGSGVLGPDAYAEGDGWGVYAERGGIMVNDGKSEVCISPKTWNPKMNSGQGKGPWAYEFAQSKAWVATDDDSSHLHLSVAHGRIYVSYRSSASVTYPDMYVYYDFSQSQRRIGVDQVLRPDGQPFPWSAPCRVRASAMGVVTRSDGDHLYAALDDSGAGHSTADGALLELERTDTFYDDGSGDTLLVYLQTERFDALREKKRITKVDLEYFDPSGGQLSIYASTDFARATQTLIKALDQVTDGTVSDTARLRLPTALRGPCEQFELRLAGGSASDRLEVVRRLQVTFKRLRTTAP